MPNPRILTLDPSFRHFGWVIIDINSASEDIVAAGVIVTKKADKKLKRYVSDDDHRCSQLIASALTQVILKWQPTIICAEALSVPRSSRAAMTMGMSWAVLSAVSFLQDIPVLQVSTQEAKEVNAGSKKASKDEVRAAVCRRYPKAKSTIAHIKPPSLHEHTYDAIAAAVACFDSTEIATLRRIAS